MAAAGFGFVEAGNGDLGIGERDPRHARSVEADGETEQRPTDDEARLLVGCVGELRAAGDVADRQHPAVRGAEPLVDDDACLVGADTRGVEAEAVDRGRAAGGDEQVRALDRPDARAVGDANENAAGGAVDGRDGLRLGDLDAFGAQRPDRVASEFGVFLGQRAAGIEDGYAGAETAVRLRQF